MLIKTAHSILIMMKKDYCFCFTHAIFRLKFLFVKGCISWYWLRIIFFKNISYPIILKYRNNLIQFKFCSVFSQTFHGFKTRVPSASES